MQVNVTSHVTRSVPQKPAEKPGAVSYPLRAAGGSAKQGSLSPREASTEGSGVSGSASECQASKRTSPEDIRAWWRHSADLLRLPFIRPVLFSFRTHS
ncbi:R-linalool synthase [Clarias magur]|uniref:R-linalool synthase n=1 Tax=Clarias magur TaxID=1594786 RepID=A0A8J4XF26_CLAMG|nr:R-linalool synthase [Clarias magur]